MRKFFVFLLGVISGVILTFLFALVFNKVKNQNYDFFDEPGEVYPYSSFTVTQALNNGTALARPDIDFGSMDDVLKLVLLYDEDGEPYYDQQYVVAPFGKCYRQVGVYRYITVKDVRKTVPILMLYDEE